ncbi:MAG: SH3 domain-containing protein [Polyangiaceae bacterium]|nr:SH3 domain-containing protein [Polyangiaceae bacterium]
MAKVPTAVRIQVPPRGADALPVTRVGVIAAVGFVVGIVWPRVAGVHLVPRAPVEAAAIASEGASDPAAPATVPAQPAPAVAPPAAAAASAEPPPPPDPAGRFSVGDAKITSCKDKKGSTRNDCAGLEVSGFLEGKLQALATCEGADGAEGVLSLGLDLDFEAGKVVDVVRGKSTTIADPAGKRLFECARRELMAASLAGLGHHYPRYVAYFPVTVRAAATPAPEPQPGGEPIAGASGLATVSFEVALVREAPKDGDIVARLLRGTRVTVTGKKDDWYRIKYDAKGSEGWVYRTAIGL